MRKSVQSKSVQISLSYCGGRFRASLYQWRFLVLVSEQFQSSSEQLSISIVFQWQLQSTFGADLEPLFTGSTFQWKF